MRNWRAKRAKFFEEHARFVRLKVLLYQQRTDRVHVHYFPSAHFKHCMIACALNVQYWYTEQWYCGCNKLNFHSLCSGTRPPTTT